METDMKQFLRCLAVLALLLATARVGWADFSFNLDFAQNGSLPSAQGLNYHGNVSESTAYSVSGGLLDLNTIQFSSDVSAYYELPGGYDRTLLNTELAARVYVQQTSNSFGLAFTYYDSAGLTNQTTYGQFVVTHTGWKLPGTGFSGTFTDPTAFHDFALQSSAATDTFTFLVDGVVVATGSRLLENGTFGSDVYFGDGSPTGGNVKAEIASVRYRNTDQPLMTPVPAPPSIVLAAFGVIGVMIVPGWRRVVSR
jgi:hypothetical protein